MEIRGTKADPVVLYEVIGIITRVGRELYGGNLVVPNTARQLSSRSVQVRVAARSSYAPGARRNRIGRRTTSACWHAYRDVIRAILTYYPDATARTALRDPDSRTRSGRPKGMTYRGPVDFEERHLRTASVNIGSMVAPAYMPELCECDDTPPTSHQTHTPRRDSHRSSHPAVPKVGETVRHNEFGWTGVVLEVIPQPDWYTASQTWESRPDIISVEESDGYRGDWYADVLTIVE